MITDIAMLMSLDHHSYHNTKILCVLFVKKCCIASLCPSVTGNHQQMYPFFSQHLNISFLSSREFFMMLLSENQ